MLSHLPGTDPPADEIEAPPQLDPPLSLLWPGAVRTLSESLLCPKAADTRR